LLGRTLNVLAWLAHDRGELAMARSHAERALGAAEQLGNPSFVAHFMSTRGELAFVAGQWDDARADFERAVALHGQVDQSPRAGVPLVGLGRLWQSRGVWEKATGYLEAAVATVQPADYYSVVPAVEVLLAERTVLEGRPAAAQARLTALLARPVLEARLRIAALVTLAWASLELDEVAAAEALIAGAITRARADQVFPALGDALRVQALVCTRRQRWSEAERSLAEGLSLTRRMPYPHAEARLQQVSGLLHLAKGEPEAAPEPLQAALAIFRRLGAAAEAARTWRALQSVPPREVSAHPALSQPTRQGGATGPPTVRLLTRTERQAWALEALRTAGPLSPRAYATALAVSVDTALRDLQELLHQGLVQAVGTTKDRRYLLSGQEVRR
jgi:tetratricopeptide (TPR) repeat protein